MTVAEATTHKFALDHGRSEALLRGSTPVAAVGSDTTKEVVMDRFAWSVELASAILTALMLLVRGRRNGWI
jgi:hypothetical protein